MKRIKAWLLGILKGAVIIKSTPVTPSEDKADHAYLYVADFAAGKACLHSRTEDGKVVKLYPGAALTAADGSTVDTTYGAEEAAVIANNVTRIAEIEAILVANGLGTAAS